MVEEKKDKLILSSRKSIHKPIEVEIDGKTYQNRPLSRTLFEEVKKHEKDALAGDIDALYKQVQILYGVPIEVLNKLDIRDVSSMLEYTMTQILNPPVKTDKEKAEKNGSKPGQDKSASSPASSRAN